MYSNCGMGCVIKCISKLFINFYINTIYELIYIYIVYIHVTSELSFKSTRNVSAINIPLDNFKAE
jgi:hypothetical protein